MKLHLTRQKSGVVLALALGCAIASGRARADDKPQDGSTADAKELDAKAAEGRSFTLSGSATATSDYVYRGLSLTRGGPAGQASLTLRHNSGLFAGISTSNVDMGAGGKIEIDGTAGYAQDFGNFSFGVGANYYGYPRQVRGSQISYFELGSTASYTMDAFRLGGQFYFSPNTSGPQGGMSYYVGAGLSYAPIDALVFSVGAGRSLYELANGYDDYLASVAYTWSAVTMELKYTATDPGIGGIGGNRVTASLIYSF